MSVEFCQNLFLHLLRWSCVFLFFNLLMWCITLIDLWILKTPCNTGINPTWLWYRILLMYCWILIASIFVSMFINYIGLQFSFFVVSLSGFGIRVMVASYSVVRSISSSANFWNSFRKIGVNSSLSVWWNLPVKLSDPGLLLIGSF